MVDYDDGARPTNPGAAVHQDRRRLAAQPSFDRHAAESGRVGARHPRGFLSTDTLTNTLLPLSLWRWVHWGPLEHACSPSSQVQVGRRNFEAGGHHQTDPGVPRRAGFWAVRQLRHCFGPSRGESFRPSSAPVAPCGVLFVVPLSARC